MFAKLGHAVAHHPWRVIAAWVVAAALIMPFAPELEANSDQTDAFSSGELIVGVATVVLILVLLAAVFRSPSAALVPLFVVGLVFVIANALIAVVAGALDFEVADTLTSFLIVVLFGIGTD